MTALFGFFWVAAIAALFSLNASAQTKPTIKVGYSKCAQCFSMELLPQFTKDVNVEVIPFNSASDVLTALMSKGIDVGQVTYLHYVMAIDRGFNVVAISGHVNGGSDMIMGKELGVKPGDWDGLKKVIAQYKKDGKPFRIATSRGSAQDLQIRGEFAVHGINPSKDVTFVNVPNPSDHAAVLARHEAEMICMVEPFASQVRLSGAGASFGRPYDQATGKLTGLIITRADVIAVRRPDVQHVVTGITQLVDHIKTDQTGWSNAIVKATGLDPKIANAALQNVYPDSSIYRKRIIAIGAMMKDLKYTSTDDEAALDKGIDYSFVTSALGKDKSALGY
jgi:ABC-type nitrate/sulfonate/bicarbonate transport system substrate-binding protein